jgi:hypothetical protein
MEVLWRLVGIPDKMEVILFYDPAMSLLVWYQSEWIVDEDVCKDIHDCSNSKLKIL